eukprot:m.57730 g.57730  ORF g.57730 m.57730 type:complete len:821 (-) comp9370_c0_seq2:1719-4181(-)
MPSKAARWQYYLSNSVDDKNLGWKSYDAAGTKELEEQWQQQQSDPSTRVPWQLKSGYFAYEINLDTMTQKNLESGTVRHVRRVGPGETASKVAPVGNPVHKTAADYAEDDGPDPKKALTNSKAAAAAKDVDVTAVEFTLSDDVLAQVFLWLDTYTLLTVIPAVSRTWRKVRSLMTGVTLTLNPTTAGLFSQTRPPPFHPDGRQILANFASQFAQVSVLDLSGTSGYLGTEVNPPKTRLDFVPRLFPSIAIIRLRGCEWISDEEVRFLAEIPSILGVDAFGTFVTDGALLELAEKKPHLKVFGGKIRSNATFMAIAEKCKGLTSASFEFCLRRVAVDLLALGKHGATLKALTLIGIPSEIDMALFEVIPNLRFLTLHSFSNTMPLVQAAVAACPRLQSCTVVCQPVQSLRLLDEAEAIADIRLRQFELTQITFATHVVGDTEAVEMVEKWPRHVLEDIIQGNESDPAHDAFDAPGQTFEGLIHAGYAVAVKAFIAVGVAPTPHCMMLATINGHPEIVEIIVKAGRNVDEPWETDGSSPLAVATFFGHLDVMRVLLALGADVNYASAKNDGETPLSVAKKSSDNEAKKLLGLKTKASGSNWKFPTEAEMSLETFAHLGTQRSALQLSEHSGQWFSFQRDEGWDGVEEEENGHPDCEELEEDLQLTRTDLIHRLFSELPESVRDIASQLELAVTNLRVGAGDADSTVESIVFSGNTSDVRSSCLRGLGIKRTAWRWSTLNDADYASMTKFCDDPDYPEDEDDDDESDHSKNCKIATQILAGLTDQFVFTFSDPPVYICPKLYGGRHEESGCLVALLVTREHGD